MKRFFGSTLWTVFGVIVLFAVLAVLLFDGKRDTPLTELPAYYWLLYGALFVVLVPSIFISTLDSGASGVDILFYSSMTVFNILLVFFKVLDSDWDVMLPFFLIMGLSFGASAVRSLIALRATRNLQRL